MIFIVSEDPIDCTSSDLIPYITKIAVDSAFDHPIQQLRTEEKVPAENGKCLKMISKLPVANEKCSKIDLQHLTDSVESTNQANVSKTGKHLKSAKCLKVQFEKNFIKVFVEKLFYKQGIIVGKYPMWFIVVPFVICLILSCGMFRFRIIYNVGEMLTPYTAYSKHEANTFLKFFQDEGGLFILQLGVAARDGGSVLREGYVKEVLSFFYYLMHNYTIRIDHYDVSFANLQVSHQDDNHLPITILQSYRLFGEGTNFTYPVVFINQENYYIGNVLRNVQVDPTTNHITYAGVIWFIFSSGQQNETHANLLQKWVLSFVENSPIKQFPFPKLKYYIWNNDIAVYEIVRNCWVAGPFVVLAFISVFIFSYFVAYTKNPVTSKPVEAFASIISVVMSCGAGFGLVFYSGYPFSGLTAALPILVLALGMDVTYITLRNWRMTDTSLPPHIRLAETMQESGCSVVITTLTNVLSAAIGCYTNMLMVFIFCLTMSLSLIILFILQITFFAGFLAYSGRREASNKHGCIICITISKKEDKLQPSSTATLHHKYTDWWFTCSNFMAKIICTNYCRFFVTVGLLVYLATAVYCCFQMKVGITVDKLFPSDSPLAETYQLDQQQISSAGHLLYVVVSQPPNFSQPEDYKLFTKMVANFETVPYCVGTNATALWSRSYEMYAQFIDENYTSNFLQYLDSFLDSATGSKWANFLKTESVNGSLIVNKFIFTVAYRKVNNWNLRNAYTYVTRDIASKYPQFSVTSWFEDNENFITDQLDSIPGNTLQDLLVTIICMTLVCIMFIPNIFNTICALLTVLSINVGTFGYLMAWDVALDPVSMSGLLLSIGYSVDFTSHISYHYYASSGKDQQEKLTSALSSIGLPMLESGLSTLLCAACLCCVPAYMEVVFFKNMFLVILFGLLHGLIILPTYLAWIPLNSLQRLFPHTLKF